MKKTQKIEVAKSFGQTVQIEQFQPRNFFCSLKTDATPEEFEEVSKELYELCKKSVEADIEAYKYEKENANIIQIENAYKNQPEVIKDTMTKEERAEFERKEAEAHAWQDSKRQGNN